MNSFPHYYFSRAVNCIEVEYMHTYPDDSCVYLSNVELECGAKVISLSSFFQAVCGLIFSVHLNRGCTDELKNFTFVSHLFHCGKQTKSGYVNYKQKLATIN